MIQDFKIEMREDLAPHAINLVGIESPGLTGAVPIARRVVRMMAEREELTPNPDFNPRRKGIARFADVAPGGAEAAHRGEPGLRRADLPL